MGFYIEYLDINLQKNFVTFDMYGMNTTLFQILEHKTFYGKEICKWSKPSSSTLCIDIILYLNEDNIALCQITCFSYFLDQMWL